MYAQLRLKPAATPAWSPLHRLAGLLLLVGGLSGCAAIEKSEHPVGANDAAHCAVWFETVDAATQQAGVSDGSAHRLAGYPFLRSNRFLAALGEEVADNPVAFETWVGRLAELDRHARATELANLPLQFVPPLVERAVAGAGKASVAGTADKPAIAARTQQCSMQAHDALMAATRASAPARRLLAGRAQVPDDYSALKRALGLYALTRGPFFKGVERWQQATTGTFSTRASEPADPAAPVVRYTPAGEPLAAGQVATLYARRQPDALGMARLSAQDEALLLRAYAPDVDIETRGGYDRFGLLQWADDASAGQAISPGSAPSPVVALGQPVMYQRIAYTRYEGQTLLQLVYSVWFPERPSAGGVDLLSGKLDSVVLRLTLAPDGTPWLYDSIHSCGCYHLFLPTPRAVPRPPPPTAEGGAAAPVEWAFVPATLPAMAFGQRVVMRLASGTHYVEGLRPLGADAPAGTTGAATPFTLVDDNALRSLPVAAKSGAPVDSSGVTRSAFWPSGIVPGTERGERLLFWPIGIDSPGAMRQWGRQPTAFVGRRHFDDARLMELRFELKGP